MLKWDLERRSAGSAGRGRGVHCVISDPGLLWRLMHSSLGNRSLSCDGAFVIGGGRYRPIFVFEICTRQSIVVSSESPKGQLKRTVDCRVAGLLFNCRVIKEVMVRRVYVGPPLLGKEGWPGDLRPTGLGALILAFAAGDSGSGRRTAEFDLSEYGVEFAATDEIQNRVGFRESSSEKVGPLSTCHEFTTGLYLSVRPAIAARLFDAKPVDLLYADTSDQPLCASRQRQRSRAGGLRLQRLAQASRNSPLFTSEAGRHGGSGYSIEFRTCPSGSSLS